MKKLIGLLFIIFLFSCEKEDVSCYKCNTTVDDVVYSITTCEMNPSEARKFEIALRLQAFELGHKDAIVICDKTECLIK